MNVFFELGDYAVKDFGGKYFALYNTSKIKDSKIKVVTAHERYLMMYSERVWAEEEDDVRYLKNRMTGRKDSPIDMKEFVWVKLKSRPM
jgi:hypothetical protein